MSDDLIRRIDTAINNRSLHPNYARELLREAKEALEETEEQIVLNAWCAAAPSLPSPNRVNRR
jgi:hypothetical protein